MDAPFSSGPAPSQPEYIRAANEDFEIQRSSTGVTATLKIGNGPDVSYVNISWQGPVSNENIKAYLEQQDVIQRVQNLLGQYQALKASHLGEKHQDLQLVNTGGQTKVTYEDKKAPADARGKKTLKTLDISTPEATTRVLQKKIEKYQSKQGTRPGQEQKYIGQINRTDILSRALIGKSLLQPTPQPAPPRVVVSSGEPTPAAPRPQHQQPAPSSSSPPPGSRRTPPPKPALHLQQDLVRAKAAQQTPSSVSIGSTSSSSAELRTAAERRRAAEILYNSTIPGSRGATAGIDTFVLTLKQQLPPNVKDNAIAILYEAILEPTESNANKKMEDLKKLLPNDNTFNRAPFFIKDERLAIFEPLQKDREMPKANDIPLSPQEFKTKMMGEKPEESPFNDADIVRMRDAFQQGGSWNDILHRLEVDNKMITTLSVPEYRLRLLELFLEKSSLNADPNIMRRRAVAESNFQHAFKNSNQVAPLLGFISVIQDPRLNTLRNDNVRNEIIALYYETILEKNNSLYQQKLESLVTLLNTHLPEQRDGALSLLSQARSKIPR